MDSGALDRLIREAAISPRQDKHLLWMSYGWAMQPVCLPSFLTPPQLSFYDIHNSVMKEETDERRQIKRSLEHIQSNLTPKLWEF